MQKMKYKEVPGAKVDETSSVQVINGVPYKFFTGFGSLKDVFKATQSELEVVVHKNGPNYGTFS